jgi:large conductance mechanosensitive channel
MMNENITKVEKKGVEGVKKVGSSLKFQITGFIDFIRTQGVVAFAVAFILGGAVSLLVKSGIDNIINPILGVVLGRAKDLSDSFISFFGAKIMWGKFINDLINFFVLAAVVYFGVKKIGLDKLDKPKN